MVEGNVVPQRTLQRLERDLGGVSLRSDGRTFELHHEGRCLLVLPVWPEAVGAAEADVDADAVRVEGPGGAATLSVEGQTVCWQFDARRQVHDTLACFTGGQIAAEQWHTFVFNGHDRLWDAAQDVRVPIKSCNAVVGEVRANWFGNVPPRVAAFDLGAAGWLGVSLPGALSVAQTTLGFHRGRFGIELSEYRPSADAGPLRVYLRAGLRSPEEALSFHAEMTRKLGHWRDRREHPAWWSLPRWGMYDENCFVGRTSLDAPDARDSPLTAARIRAWAEQVRQVTGVDEFFIAYDQGYFRRYGEYVPVDSLGGVEGFRGLIDEMRRRGVRTGLYCHPFHADLGIPVIAEHPEWLVQGDNPSAPPVSGDMRLGTLDWTHPGARDYMAGVVRRIVSAEPGCLNADWLMVNNNHVPDPLACRFHDRGWGIGDRMAYLARKAIYEAAKAHKPDVLVSFIGCDPVLQETADLFWVNESWGESCDNWHRMARAVSRCLPGTLLAVNPYILSHTKHAEFATVMPAYSVPAAMPLNHIHTHGHSKQWQPMTPENLRRWAASWRVYANAPMHADQPRQVDLDGDRLTAWRKHARGPLAGFYAALALGRRALVTYSEREARVMACDYVVVDVPLPPGAVVSAVEAVAGDGAVAAQPGCLIERDGERFVRLELSDSGAGQTGGGGPLYVRITYTLPGQGCDAAP